MTADLRVAFLADPTRCPSCTSPLSPERDLCRACGLRLTGPVAGRLWQVSLQAAELLDTRARLIDELRRAPAPAPVVAPAAPRTGERTGLTGPPESPRPPRTPEWSRRRVQNLLLALGVGLLGVAAVIFVAVSWDRLGVGGRSAVMAGLTALAGLAAVRTHRRGLVSTAEWLSLLTVGLALVDCFGARAADLAGLAATDGDVYWAGALAVVALVAGLLAIVLPTRTLPMAAAGLGQLPLPLLSVHLAADVDLPWAVLATGLTAQAVAALALAAAWPFGSGTAAARRLVAGGGAVALVVAALAAVGAAYGEDGSMVVGSALLIVLAGAVVVAGTVLGDRRTAGAPVVSVLDGFAAMLVVVAVWAPAYDAVPTRWLPVVLAAAATALLAATLLVPAARRTPAALVALAAGVLPAVAALAPVSRAVDGMLEPLGHPWASRVASAVPVVADRPAVLVLLVAGAALALGAAVLRAAGLVAGGLVAGGLVAGSVPVLTAAAVLTAPALGATFPAALAAGVALAAGLLAAGALLDARGWVVPGWSLLGSGLVLLALSTAWALAVDLATLLTLPAVLLALLAGALAARGNEGLRPWRVALVATAVLAGVAEAAALTRYGDAGWPAVWSVALGLLAAAATAIAVTVALRTAVEDRFWAPLHTAAVVVAGAAAVAAVGALARWSGAPVAGAGLAVSVAAAALLVLTAVPLSLLLTLLLPGSLVVRRPVRGTLQLVGGLGAAVGLGLSALDGDRLWVALLVVGLGVAVVATTPVRHGWGWVAAVLLAASSWVRLALADVEAPEAYTVPGGVALLVVGALRRRGDPAYGSWQAYGSGLSLVLVPSLLRAVTDTGDLRPLLLALAAVAVLSAGAARRLQAPLVLGAAVLGVDALVQLAPYLAAAYDVVPRWVTIGLLGLALVGAGATYEQRVRELRRVGRHVSRLG